MGSGWGVAVTVLVPTVTGEDSLGNPVHGEPVREVVEDVLVAPGSTSSLDASRPEGTSAALTLHFPKGYDRRLRGCEVVLPEPWGGPWRVVGDPMPYEDGLCPGPWHMPVEVEAAHG